MSLSESLSAQVAVKLLDFAYNRDGYAGLCCLNCGDELNIHQPESGHPERMLETCANCGDWYLLDYLPDWNRAIMVLLPDGGHFLQLLDARPC